MGDTLKAGDIVELKSGGPRMTVKGVFNPLSDKQVYTCQWFGGKKLESGHFHIDSLKHVSDEIKDDGN